MNNKKVSVCIPVYNGEHTIEATLESVIRQTYGNLEIIIVDNASTDATLKKIQQFNDQRIRLYVNEKNIGMAGNWNKCLEYVTTEYVHFLCADDLMEPECIEKKVAAIKDEKTVMVYSASELINDKNEVLMKRRQYRDTRILNGMKLARKSFLSRNLYGEPSNVLFSAKAIKDIGVFSLDTCYVTDWEYWLRVSTLGNVVYLNDSLVKYRISVGNTTSKLNRRKMLDDDLVMINKVKKDGLLKVTRFDVLFHRVMYVTRMYIREMYMKIKC